MARSQPGYRQRPQSWCHCAVLEGAPKTQEWSNSWPGLLWFVFGSYLQRSLVVLSYFQPQAASFLLAVLAALVVGRVVQEQKVACAGADLWKCHARLFRQGASAMGAAEAAE